MTQFKHAYLIMAHERPDVFKVLLQMIDNKRNDIYVHIDNKCDLQPFVESFGMIKESKIVLIEDRIDVRWAHVSQVLAEFNLFKAAYDNGAYLYYHLLSGVDLPIKSQDYIHDFFDRQAGTEYVGFSYPVPIDHYLKFHIFPKHLREKSCMKSKLRSFFIKIQNIIGYQINVDFDLRKGANWVSITNELVSKIISDTPKMIKKFKYSISLDECYKQTIAFSYPNIYQKVYDISNEYHSNMRLIDWKRGTPYSYSLKDLSEIMASDKLFCRKIYDINLAHYLLNYFV